MDALVDAYVQSEFALKPIFDKDPIQRSSTFARKRTSRSLLSSRSLTRTRSNRSVRMEADRRVGVCSQADL